MILVTQGLNVWHFTTYVSSLIESTYIAFHSISKVVVLMTAYEKPLFSLKLLVKHSLLERSVCFAAKNKKLKLSMYELLGKKIIRMRKTAQGCLVFDVMREKTVSKYYLILYLIL